MTDAPAAPESGGEDQSEKKKVKPPKPTVVVLVRHGVTAETGPILSGRTPGIDLSETGRQQAAATAERLSALPVAAVYASPIERTHQTAEAIAARFALDVLPLEGMIEAD